MPSGIVIVDKPGDWTSQDVTAKLRGVFSERRIGHGGTLDPMATGVLPVFVGRATRAVSFFENADKEYLASLRLGLVTNTQDVTGEILFQTATRVSDDDLLAVLKTFEGPQEQLPPMYSAVKIGGKKLYELARKGQEVARTPRSITIRALDCLGRDPETGDVLLRVCCSKGTYIRTLCADIGQALGCGGCMSALRRTRAGQYSLDQAVPLADLIAAKETGDPAAYLLPVDSLFSHYPACTLTRREETFCRNGNPLPMPETPDGFYRVYGPEGAFLMLGRAENGRMYTVKSFFEVK